MFKLPKTDPKSDHVKLQISKVVIQVVEPLFHYNQYKSLVLSKNTDLNFKFIKIQLQLSSWLLHTCKLAYYAAHRPLSHAYIFSVSSKAVDATAFRFE